MQKLYVIAILFLFGLQFTQKEAKYFEYSIPVGGEYNLTPIISEPTKDTPYILDDSLTVYYNEVDSIPQFIRDSISYDFNMANPGEEWSSGCIGNGKPRFRLNYLARRGNEWLISYERGGWGVYTAILHCKVLENGEVRILYKY